MDETYVYRLNNAFEHGYEQSPSVYIYIYPARCHFTYCYTNYSPQKVINLFIFIWVLVLKTLHVHMLEK